MIEIKKTPIGDENIQGNRITTTNIIIEIKKTPIGDENEHLKMASALLWAIEIKETPIGDENKSQDSARQNQYSDWN